MATVRQKRAVEKLVGNGGNVTKAMLEANYSPNTANTPQKLTESRGFKEICEENGLTETFLTKALFDDIRDKPKQRERELRLAFQVTGKLNDSEPKGTTNNIFVGQLTIEQQRRLAGEVLRITESGPGQSNSVSDSDQS